MQIIKNPERKDWNVLLQRPYVDNQNILKSVQTILNAVKQHGDEAIRAFTKKFDGIELDHFDVSEEEIAQAQNLISTQLKQAILQSKKISKNFTVPNCRRLK